MQDIQLEQDGCPLESLWNPRDIFDDEFSNVKSSGFTFLCTSPDAYDSQNQKFKYEEESFHTEGQKTQSWSGTFSNKSLQILCVSRDCMHFLALSFI